MREALREELGGTYGGNVGTRLTFVPIENTSLIIEFTSAPQRVDKLKQRIFAALAASYQFEQNPGPAGMLAVQGVYEALTPERLKELLERHVSLRDYIRVTLLPER